MHDSAESTQAMRKTVHARMVAACLALATTHERLGASIPSTRFRLQRVNGLLRGLHLSPDQLATGNDALNWLGHIQP
jgi:hypothetical protein